MRRRQMKTVFPNVARFRMTSCILLCSVFIQAVNALGVDVVSAYIAKGRIHAQTNAAGPQLKNDYFIFEAAVRVTAPNSLDDAYWSQPPFPFPPGDRNPIFRPSIRMPLLWYRMERWTAQTSMDNLRPHGDYHLTFDTANDGARTNHLWLGGQTYPNAPRVANYTAAQSIDPANDFVLQWLSFVNGSVNDLITLTVMQATNNTGIVFETGTFPGAPSALEGTRTSVTIPQGTLAPGRVYLGRLRFDRVVSIDRTNYPSEVGFTSYFATTDFYLGTLGSDSNTAPRLEAVYPPPGAVDVPTDAPVIWTFSKPMQRASGLTMLFNTNTTFWTTDRLSFVYLPLSPFSTNTEVNWSLQRWQPFLLMGDLLSNPLFTDISGYYETGTKQLLPAPQPRLSMPTVVTNTAHMLLHGESNRIYTVQVSTNLSNWASFSTNVTVTGPSLVTHPAVSSSSQRFYRAVVLR